MLEIKRKGNKPVTTQEGAPDAAHVAPASSDAGKSSAPSTPASKRPLRPFTALDASRNYRSMYRAACDFHERHNLSSQSAGQDDAYWERVTDDMTETVARFDGDPFLTALLIAVFEELEREAKAARQAGNPTHE